MIIQSVTELQQWLASGQSVKYVFFWGHRNAHSQVTKSCFSQWYPAVFSDEEGHRYLSAEHYMMAEKARLFGDTEVYQQILAAGNPGQAKALGRQVRHFDEMVWQAHRFAIVCAGNYLKFEQNTELKTFLLQTGDRILVEASPVDSIWGIGMAVDHPDVTDPNQWQGENLLGFALMTVRNQLSQ